MVAVRGAINLLHLRSRGTTPDVDVIGSDFDNQASMLWDEAMQDAFRKYRCLGTEWLNPETQMSRSLTWKASPSMPPPEGMHSRPKSVASSLGESRSGHMIWIMLWSTSMSTEYTHEYQPIPVATAVVWARQFNHQTTDQLLRT